MSIRLACAYMLMVGGILLFVGGASQSEAQTGGTAGSGSGSGSTGGPDRPASPGRRRS